jgi:CBS domain-containing protein
VKELNADMLLVKHMMLTNVITVSPSKTVKETIEILYKKHIGCVVSIDENKKCIGIFTERDAIRLVAENVKLNQPLSNVMTKNVISIQEDSSINELRRIIQTHSIRHLPVVNQKNKLVGLLSVRALLDQFFGLNSQIC